MLNKKIRLVTKKENESDVLEEDLDGAPNSFFEEIKVVDVLEVSENDDIIDFLCKKVRIGGKVVLSGVDGLEVCRQVWLGSISLDDVGSQFFRHVRNLFSIVSLREIFLSKNWEVNFSGVKNGRYLVEATRNE